MAALWPLLAVALCLAASRVTASDFSEVPHPGSEFSDIVSTFDDYTDILLGRGLPWMDMWNKMIYIGHKFDRQMEERLGRQSLQQTQNFSAGGLSTMELEVDDAAPGYDLTSGRRQQTAAERQELRYQAMARAVGPFITPIANEGSSRECQQASQQYLANIFKQYWATRMFDATGKLPDGIIGGNVNLFGNWDECLNTTGYFNFTEGGITEIRSFTGKMVMTYLFQTDSEAAARLKSGAPIVRQFPSPAQQPVGLAPILPSLPGVTGVVGVCIPSMCTAGELTLGLNLAFQASKLKVGAYADPTVAYTKDDTTPLTAGDIVMIVILSITAFMMLVGTVVDVIGVKAAASPDSVWASLHAPVKRMLPSLPRRIFLAFSVYTNGRKLLDTTSSGDTLGCLHGIRFLSMTWVILGHNYLFTLFYKFQNLQVIGSYFQSVAFTAIDNATVSVDSFFFLSGLLVSYIFMRNIERSKGKVNLVMFYVHRYIRLTPVMMLIIGFIASLYDNLGSGPWWGYASQSNPQVCRDNWWTNMLYINNLVHMDRQCIGQTWYLANDMQMYIFSPLVLLPLYHWPVFGQLWIILLVCFFTGINAMVTAVNHIGEPGGGDQNLRYMKPWTRAMPYLVGLYMGWVLHKTRGRKIHIPAPLVMIGWIASSLTGCLIVYGTYDYSAKGIVQPKTVLIIYNMLDRTAWSVCLAWLVFACVNGYGGPINALLSWKAFIPLSRVTYTCFLVSIDIQQFYWLTAKTAQYLDQTSIVYVFLASLPVIFSVALLFSLAFESPMIALEKIMFPQLGRPPPKSSANPAQPASVEANTVELNQLKSDEAGGQASGASPSSFQAADGGPVSNDSVEGLGEVNAADVEGQGLSNAGFEGDVRAGEQKEVGVLEGTGEPAPKFDNQVAAV